MTERAVAFPLARGEPARPKSELTVVPGALVGTPPAGARTAPAARPAAVARPATAGRHPVHVAVAVGVTAGLYAVSLAGVTALQATTDTQIAADRAPAAAAIASLRAHNDALEADLARADAGYGALAGAYGLLADGITSHETSLAALEAQIAAVEGSAKALKVPTVASLPRVSGRTVYVSRPAAHACTTASGKPC